MKSNTKTTLLTRELHEVVIVRQGKRFRRFCDGCRSEGEFLSLDAAVQVSGVGAREILQFVDTREIHAQEAASGLMLVCVKSLGQYRLR